MLKRLLAKASPILGPRADWLGLCLLCRQPSDEVPLLCSWCRQALHQDGWQCRLCAAPLPEQYAESGLVCGRCQRRPPPWQRLQVIGDYRAPYTQLIPRLKYSGQILLAPLLARVLADHLNLDDPPQAIIPVPLHWWRQWWRGFNQAEEIGRALSELTDIPCDSRLLRRVRATPQQTRLSAGQRRRNLRDAFEMAPHHYRHVALLDDVVTTGATAGQLTRLLHEHGVTRVEVWAICRTLRHPP
ncbi:competence protein ComF [Aeromonas caviae]|uniref:ComF family protein n=1 Tax=Aeromonas TaxID=642 RepID=UPI001B32FD67|nr:MULTISPECIES: ComF family protein [Aeromonas]MBP4067190.1 ComF family protein [Aeromonas sp. MaB10011B]MBP4078647.1 ComF family protein [Aeromonas sp. MrichA-1]MDX7686746.1 ComF family protein [Aeromonas caviae]GKQ65627.1 competence protein ComF [Aeromonas caviae]